MHQRPMATPQSPGNLILKDALVLPSAQAPALPHTDILIEGGVITALGPDLAHPPDYLVVDARDRLVVDARDRPPAYPTSRGLRTPRPPRLRTWV